MKAPFPGRCAQMGARMRRTGTKILTVRGIYAIMKRMREEMPMNIETLVLGPLQTNCYILNFEKEALLVDPAADAELILKKLHEKEWSLKGILLTHTHFDHMGAVDAIVKATGAPLYCPYKDAPGLRDWGKNLSLHFTRHTMQVDTVPAVLLHEWDTVPFGNERLRVLETPGHTVGSVCYEGEDFLFSGDTLFYHGYGRTDIPGGSEEQLSQSLSRLLTLENRTVYPGYGQPTSLEDERIFFGF